MESALLQQTQDSKKLREKFIRLTNQWRMERGTSSNMTTIHLQPSYQRIIGLGPAVLPLIFEAMSREPDFGFGRSAPSRVKTLFRPLMRAICRR